ncbi:MAG: hypothetical protein QOE70_620 [Chthoniobacter sp.]|jgi:hypothetical protein|nr:hypothetical protein [Chthoniobacter sp.]
MSDSPQDFDLKFLPDWLKEKPAENRYANYEGDTGDRPRRDRDDRRGPPRGDRPPERRGPRPPQGDRPRGPRPDRPPGERPRSAAGGERRGDKRPFDRRDEARPPREAAPPALAELRIEFLPEPNAAVGIAKQIKTSNRAYAVFQTAKLFLERPERHRVRITSSKPDVPLHQIGDGPVSFDRAGVERGAFHQAREEYYREETVQGEPIKGNFSNVARCRATGALLGPTNHHSYQPGLRKLYEERFSRRMSFPEFQQQEIEILTAEQAVADWKEQARTTTTYTTAKEAEPITFKSLSEAEQHFRKTYLPQLVKSGVSLECDGPASRAALDRHVNAAVREAWERERVFPQGLVNALRSYFSDVGLHFFKHRKRVLHVCAVKPVRHPEGQPFSDGITALLKAIEAQPRIKRPGLAAKILGAGHEAPEAAPRKAQLAADLHYLVHIGYVIEFADGSFDLPLSHKAEAAPRSSATPAGAPPDSAEEVDVAAERAEAIAESVPPPASPAAPESTSAEQAPPAPVLEADRLDERTAAPVSENAPEPAVEAGEELPPEPPAVPDLAEEAVRPALEPLLQAPPTFPVSPEAVAPAAVEAIEPVTAIEDTGLPPPPPSEPQEAPTGQKV